MMRHWGKIILWSVLAAFAFLIIDIGRYFVYPNVADLQKNRPGKTAFMEYREDAWKAKDIKKNISATWVPLAQISPYAMKAVIIAEDDKFWSHEGFDFEAMQKALEKDIKKKTFKAGGSTISQQLAKNLYLTPAKNPIRKVKEAILTWRIEQQLSKKRILELYLNVAEWGDGLFGIETAARKYYGKSARNLGAREAAELAAALPNPRRFNPDVNSRYAANRAERIYQIMVRRGMVIKAYEEVIEEKDIDPEEKESVSQEKDNVVLEKDNVSEKKDDAVNGKKDGDEAPPEKPLNDLSGGNAIPNELPK